MVVHTTPPRVTCFTPTPPTLPIGYRTAARATVNFWSSTGAGSSSRRPALVLLRKPLHPSGSRAKVLLYRENTKHTEIMMNTITAASARAVSEDSNKQLFERLLSVTLERIEYSAGIGGRHVFVRYGTAPVQGFEEELLSRGFVVEHVTRKNPYGYKGDIRAVKISW